jgi:hypothetical protein
MSQLAGLDLGYGSQLQIVRTNYLYVATKSGDGGTNAQNATFLQLFNDALNVSQTGGGLHPLTCDYIIPLEAGSGNAEPTVTGAAAAGLLLPVMGPTYESLAQASGLDATASSAADQGSSSNGSIVAILALGLVNVTVSGGAITEAAGLDILGGTGGHVLALNSAIMSLGVDASVDTGVASGSALTGFWAMADVAVDLAASDGTPSVEVNTTPTSPVMKGNAAGTTATVLSDVTGHSTADNYHIISLISLARPY